MENQYVQEKPLKTGRKRDRNVTLDILKGISMIFVIILHMDSQPYIGYGLRMTLLYAVPLYFWISGYLLVSSAQNAGFPAYLWKRVKGLLVPYIVFFAFTLFWKTTLYGTSFRWDDIKNAFLFSGEYLFNSPVLTPPLWFLHAMFLLSILFYFLARIRNKYILMLMVFALLMITLPLQTAMRQSPYWIVCLFPVALFFMILGYLCRIFSDRYQTFVGNPDQKNHAAQRLPIPNSFCAFGLLVASIFTMQLGRGDSWCITSDWYFLGAVLFAAACYLFAKESQNRVLIFAGQNSLYYLGLHAFVLELPFTKRLLPYLTGRQLDKHAAFFAYFVVSFLMISLLVFGVVWLKERILSVFHRTQGGGAREG